MTSHFLVPFNTWFLTGPTSRQCALYLGNKDPIREGREVRAGLDLRVQISHQAGTDHQIGLFFWGGLFLTDCWSHSHDSVFLRGVAEVSESLWTLTESGEGCRFTLLESRICDVHLMSLLLTLEASVFHFHWCLHILHSLWILGKKWDFQHDNPRLSVMPSSSFLPIRFP